MRKFNYLIGIGLIIISSGCASTKIEQLSGAEFVTKAEQMELVSSFNWTSYIGSSRQRAYLEYGHPAYIGDGVRTTVYWTPTSELPKEIAAQLKAGNPPWTPWWTQVDTASEDKKTD